MTRALLAAAAALLLAAPAFAQDGGSVFTNNPNELPQFLEHGTPDPTHWAGSFFHSRIRPEAPHRALARRDAPRERAVD